jgi:tetratricopeptide (TPR) repeat protein
MTAESRRPECPDAEQLAAFAEGALSPGERELIEAHLTECDDCYEALVEIAAITAQIAAPVAPRGSGAPNLLRARRSILWIGGALAAAAAVIVLIKVNAPLRSPTDPLEVALTALAQAPRAARLGFGRLSVDRAWAKEQSVLRSGNAGGEALEVRTAAQGLKVLAAQDQSRSGRRGYGLALVALREYDAAIDAFDQALQLAPGDAVIHSDLSAALLERYRISGQRADAERALAEADRALAIAPKHLEALFNRALALGELGRSEARQAWQTYIDLEPDAAWRLEATDRRDGRR